MDYQLTEAHLHFWKEQGFVLLGDFLHVDLKQNCKPGVMNLHPGLKRQGSG